MVAIRTFLDKFYMLGIRWNGVDLIDRPVVDFIGGTVAGDDANDETRVYLGSSWTTAFDFDFSAQPSQVLASDGPYTIGGKVWTYSHSAKARATTVVTNGAGLVLSPTSSASYAGGAIRSCPTLQLPLGQIGIGGLDWRTRLRVYVYAPIVTCFGLYDELIAGVALLDTVATGSPSYPSLVANDSVALYGQDGANNVGLVCQQLFTNYVDIANSSMFDLAANRVFMVEAQPYGSEIVAFRADWAAGWPLPGAMCLGPATVYGPASRNIGASAIGNVAANMALTLAIQGTSGAGAATIARVRVDYK